MERGEVTPRSNIVSVYRINLPHNKLLSASAAGRNVSHFYTNNNLITRVAQVMPEK